MQLEDLDVIVLTRREIRTRMQLGQDTMDIAAYKGVRECDVWNTLARTDDGMLRGLAVMKVD